MKTLELKLKKDVLIVDTIDFILTEEMINNKVDNIILADYEFICKGSDITEEIASEFVDFWQNMSNDGFIYENYKNNIPKKKTAVEAVISAVESKDKSIDINKCLIFVKK